ncbi:MAG: hypothetical protein ACK44B_06380 [Flavobacteriales bacterium]
MAQKTNYHISGIFNVGSRIFTANPKGWIGKTVCIQLDESDLENLSAIYLEKVRSEVCFMEVQMVDEVKLTGVCDCKKP